MVIKFDVVEAVARGLRSKNLVFNREFERQGTKIYQQIFHNKKNGDLLLKEITQSGNAYSSDCYAYSGKLRVLPFNKAESLPVWDFVKSDAIKERHIPALLVQEITPTKVVSRSGTNRLNFHHMDVAQNGRVTHYDKFFNEYFIPGKTEEMTMEKYLSGKRAVYLDW